MSYPKNDLNIRINAVGSGLSVNDEEIYLVENDREPEECETALPNGRPNTWRKCARLSVSSRGLADLDNQGVS